MVGPRRPLRGGSSRIMLGLQVSNPSPFIQYAPQNKISQTYFLHPRAYAM